MIKKTKATIWQSGHAHHDSRRMLLKQGMWERVNKPHRMERSEEISTDDARSPYSAELVKLFGLAIRRCPSVSIDADIMEGQPCIAGTRIPVRAILRAIEQYAASRMRRCAIRSSL